MLCKCKERENKMKEKAIVIINEGHTLLEEQEQLLNKTFKRWEFLKVPVNGYTLIEMKEMCINWDFNVNTVFVSPIPYMLMHLSYIYGYKRDTIRLIYVFHNDNRDKKELPNGKVIYTVAKTGWQLVH